MFQPGFSDLRVREVQCFEVRQAFQMHEPGFRDQRAAEVERAEVLQSREMNYADVGDPDFDGHRLLTPAHEHGHELVIQIAEAEACKTGQAF